MVLLTTLIINYNSDYVYVIPICILPLILKAFFDARLGLFAHVITVLLLGFIVPNNYEYMFLQIIAACGAGMTIHRREEKRLALKLLQQCSYFSITTCKLFSVSILLYFNNKTI